MEKYVFINFKFKDGSIRKRFDKEEPSQLYGYLWELEANNTTIYEAVLDYDWKADNEIKTYLSIIQRIEFKTL